MAEVGGAAFGKDVLIEVREGHPGRTTRLVRGGSHDPGKMAGYRLHVPMVRTPI